MENAAALAIQSPCLLRKPHLIPLSRSLPFFHNRRSSRVRVRAETEEKVSAVPGSTEDASVSGPPNKSSTGSGTGFGSSPSSSSSSRGEKKKRTVIRRSPIDKPALFSESQPSQQQQQQQDVNESAFLLTWLGLGFLILIEGVALAASGFLPEEWDKFFVKYLYPSFTPTVFLFVAGTVVYGVVKYQQGEQRKS